jgi:hypothetical protein
MVGMAGITGDRISIGATALARTSEAGPAVTVLTWADGRVADVRACMAAVAAAVMVDTAVITAEPKQPKASVRRGLFFAHDQPYFPGHFS